MACPIYHLRIGLIGHRLTRQLFTLQLYTFTFKYITLTGVLMFGTELAIMGAMPRYFVDFREKLNSDPNMRWTDRVYPDGVWETNLYQFYRRVLP